VLPDILHEPDVAVVHHRNGSNVLPQLSGPSFFTCGDSRARKERARLVGLLDLLLIEHRSEGVDLHLVHGRLMVSTILGSHKAQAILSFVKPEVNGDVKVLSVRRVFETKSVIFTFAFNISPPQGLVLACFESKIVNELGQ